jgi:GDP-D-mannose 3', 5'-epimerase
LLRAADGFIRRGCIFASRLPSETNPRLGPLACVIVPVVGSDEQGHDTDDLIAITGAGGFIGGHLVADLLRRGHKRIRAVDIKPVDDWYQAFPAAENLCVDLKEKDNCYTAARDARLVFHLACDMGGQGFIETNKAACMLSVMADTNMLLAARDQRAERYFYSSTACVYPVDKQTSPDVAPLKESDVYPAMPEDGYGWEKLFSERMCRHFFEDYGFATRVARYHNVYGPHGTYDYGREKAPAALCRKVITALLTGQRTIEIWGDGEQTRSFMYIDDCIHGTQMLMASDVSEPINLGSAELVTINQLVDAIEHIAGVKLERHYRPDAAVGVRGRSSDNTLIRQKLGWAPSIPLEEGIEKTYRWIYDQLSKRASDRPTAYC